ncbi:protein PROCA1 isoform X2 [Manis javanica]|uniref:protein PROCA1 isoform X2 n=1 Tax=Manis javanica TaxID=9974 RepID=UPI003C6D08FE
MHRPSLKVTPPTLTGAAGNISSAAGTSFTPSPRTVPTTMCTCTRSATVTVTLGKGPSPWETPSPEPSPIFVNLTLPQGQWGGGFLAAWAGPSGSLLSFRLLGSGPLGSLGGVGARLSPLCGRLMDCSEKTNSGSSQDVGSPCFNIIQSPCFGLIPEEECVERFWYSWCKGYRPISVAVIHHPLHHDYGADDLNEEEEEEEEAASQPPIPAQVVPAATPTDICMSTVSVPSDLVAPITIWRSESPRGESQGSRVIKKVKKTKEKEKDKETEEKVKLKKKVKKDKVTKKKSPIKSGPSPPDLSRLTSPRESAGMSESSPDSRRDLDSENSYSDPRWEEPSSEDVVESLSPRKKENTVQAKKPGVKALPVKKVIKRKSPPASNPNLS